MNVVSNLGTVFLMLVVFGPMLIVYLIIKPLIHKNKLLEKIHNKLEHYLFFNMVIRFFIEGYLDLLLCSLINIFSVILSF